MSLDRRKSFSSQLHCDNLKGHGGTTEALNLDDDT
jgi:hypothetical protein